MHEVAVGAPGAGGSPELISTFTGRALARIYRRLGAAYPTATVAWQLLSGYPIAAGASFVLFLYLDVASESKLLFGAAIAALVTVSYPIGVIRGHRALAPVRRWIRGQRDP